MGDFLIQAHNTPVIGDILKAAGLPNPTPLKRARGPYEPQALAAQTVVVGGDGPAHAALLDALARAGARAVKAQDLGEKDRADALVLDATGIKGPGDLRALYDFFHPLVGKLARCGRVLVLVGQPSATQDVGLATARRAVEGFVRSLAKEVGKRGATANLLYVEEGAEERLGQPARFFLSPRSAYVDGQPLEVSNVANAPAHAAVVHVLEGKVALVTGGARGIGAATARRLALEGAHVVVLDVPQDLDALNETARAVGGTALPLDLRDAETPARLCTFLRERFGGVDVVVHNAGITRDKTLARMEEKQWDMVLDINLQAILSVDSALLRERLLRDHARVVCLSSIGGIAGNMGQTNYGATKAGVMGYVRAQSRAHAGHGITFNAVAPGFIETRMTAAMPVAVREVGRRLNSLSQGGLPEDVAEAIMFMAAPGSHGVTGQVLRVCGQSLLGA